jgi:WD40 repeat protein
MLFVSGSQDGSIRLYNFETEEYSIVGYHNSYVNSVSISGDNIYIVSGSKDRSVRLWEIETGKHSIIG